MCRGAPGRRGGEWRNVSLNRSRNTCHRGLREQTPRDWRLRSSRVEGRRYGPVALQLVNRSRICPIRGRGSTPSSIRCRPAGSAPAVCVPHQRPCPLDEPVDPRAIKRAGAAVTVGPRKARQQFEIDLLGKTTERAVGDGVPRLGEGDRTQVLGDQADYLSADVESVERVDVEAIQDPRRRLHPHGFMIG